MKWCVALTHLFLCDLPAAPTVSLLVLLQHCSGGRKVTFIDPLREL